MGSERDCWWESPVWERRLLLSSRGRQPEPDHISEKPNAKSIPARRTLPGSMISTIVASLPSEGPCRMVTIRPTSTNFHPAGLISTVPEDILPKRLRVQISVDIEETCGRGAYKKRKIVSCRLGISSWSPAQSVDSDRRNLKMCAMPSPTTSQEIQSWRSANFPESSGKVFSRLS